MCLLAHWGWLNLVMCSHVLKVLLCWPNTAIHSHVLIGLHWLNTVMCFHMLRLIAYWLNILMCSCTGSIWQWVLICSLAHCSLAQYGNAFSCAYWLIVFICSLPCCTLLSSTLLPTADPQGQVTCQCGVPL